MPITGCVLMMSPVGLVIYEQLALALPPQLGGLQPATGPVLVAARMVIWLLWAASIDGRPWGL